MLLIVLFLLVLSGSSDTVELDLFLAVKHRSDVAVPSSSPDVFDDSGLVAVCDELTVDDVFWK